MLVNVLSHTTGQVHLPQAAPVAQHHGTVPEAGPEAAATLATGAVAVVAIAVGEAAGREVGPEVEVGARALTQVTVSGAETFL